jgi:hypothetical protein
MVIGNHKTKKVNILIVIEKINSLKTGTCEVLLDVIQSLDGYIKQDTPDVADKLHVHWYRIFINYKTYLTIILKDYPSFMAAI